MDDFPQTYVVVASINRNLELSNFSNFGDEVQVAAPGGQEGGLFGIGGEAIFSTVPEDCAIFGLFCDSYGEQAGTSQAAPHVTGVAALVAAHHPDKDAAAIKQCIVDGAESGGRAVPDGGSFVLDAEQAVLCDEELDLPTDVDIVFALDLTGSMGGELATVKTELATAIADLRGAAPDTSFRFAAVSYEDYPGFHDSSACDSTYAATYGSGDDLPFRLDHDLTDEDDDVVGAIDAMTLGNGADGPEAYGRVLWELANDGVSWRTDALRLVINVGDDLPHDTDLHEGFGDGLEVPAGLPQDTGVDPGPNATVDCGGDDIDFHDDALADLDTTGTRLLHVDSSGSEANRTAWRLWTSHTGGALAEMNSDGSIPEADLGELVISLIAASDT